MKKTARIVFCLALTVFVLPVFAQKEDEAAKERQARQIALLTQIVGDAKGLKLPENRAFVAAKAGAALWRADEKQARTLFDASVSELIAAAAEGDAQIRNKQYYNNLTYGQEPRWNILFMIANCDALLALEAMVRTRPARLTRVIADWAGEGHRANPGRLKSELSSGNGHFAANEIQNEQRLIGMAADQDPVRAIKLVRESLQKGVTYQTLGLLQKIYAKDADAANRLTEEAIGKLLSMNLVRDTQFADTISYFLNEVAREAGPQGRALRAPENLIRDMADKLLNFWLDPDLTAFYGHNSSSFPVIEKYYPDRAARVKQKFERLNKQNPHQQEYSKLLSEDLPVEEMVRRAEKMPRYMRNEVYRRAAQKMAAGGGMAEAEKMLEDNMTEDEAENYLLQIMSTQAYTLIGDGKFAEANDIINRIAREDQKINLLINLASSIYHRDRKANDKWAASVLGQARALLPDEPETYDEISAFFNLAVAYALVEPETSFRMAEGMLPALNELSQANATMTKLRNYGTFRQGEFQITSGQYSLGVHGFDNLLNVLKEKDFDRAAEIAGSFTRLDARLAYQLQLIDGNTIVSLPINTRRFSSHFVMEGE